MAAPLGGEDQQYAAVKGGDDDFPEDQQLGFTGAVPEPSHYLSPLDLLMMRVEDTVYDPAVFREQAEAEAPAWPVESAADPQPDRPVSRRSAERALRLSRRMSSWLVQWFAARPLGQRALEAVGNTIATAEQATIWAGAASQHTADLPPAPFPWYLMVPVVTALMVVRTGAAIAERYLNVQLPQNSDLVEYMERQRINLEQLMAAASVDIRTQYVDENDLTHSFLNTWPLSILYRTVQQLGLIAVRVRKQPSDAGSESTCKEPAPVPSVEPVTSSTSSSSALGDAEEHAAHSSTELTPVPETEDKTYSPVGERETKEGTEEVAEDKDRAEEEAEKDEEKTEEPPTITAEEALKAALAVISPPRTAPPQLVSEEVAAMGEAPQPQPQPQPTSEELLAAERASSAEEPGTSRKRKPTYKAPKTPFLNFLSTKLRKY